MVTLADFNVLASRFGVAVGPSGGGEVEFSDDPISAPPARMIAQVLA
jgi:hypothetical protein